MTSDEFISGLDEAKHLAGTVLNIAVSGRATLPEIVEVADDVLKVASLVWPPAAVIECAIPALELFLAALKLGQITGGVGANEGPHAPRDVRYQ